MLFNSAIWAIAAVATLGVIARPWNSPEFVWPMAGTAALVLFNLLSWRDAVVAVSNGTDVYLFLIGMMLLSEVARKEGLFDWLAAQAVTCARGSAQRLFLIIYVVGVLVTVFLSNDATAIVLTPAVLATTRAARLQPLSATIGENPGRLRRFPDRVGARLRFAKLWSALRPRSAFNTRWIKPDFRVREPHCG